MTGRKPLPPPGTTFGKWTLIEAPIESSKRGGRWLVECACGRCYWHLTTNLRRGRMVQCRSCATRERMNQSHPTKTHGAAKHGAETREYITWRGMVHRCHSPKSVNWKNYGGRGIRVCAEWRGPGGYERFVADTGPRPGPGWSIERVDVNGNYEPSNVKWILLREQARNRRTSRFITIDGETRTLREWAETSAVTVQALRARLRRGWNPRDAVHAPAWSNGRGPGGDRGSVQLTG